MVNTKIRLIIFSAAKDGEVLYKSSKTRLGADCGADHELLIATFRLKLMKVGKTSRPFRYDSCSAVSCNFGVLTREDERDILGSDGGGLVTKSCHD